MICCVIFNWNWVDTRWQ